MCCAQPIAVQAGIQGNENDRGAYKLTQIYQRPDDHLLPNHQGLFDGVFQGPVHCKTTMEGLLPASKRELRNAPSGNPVCHVSSVAHLRYPQPLSYDCGGRGNQNV